MFESCNVMDVRINGKLMARNDIYYANTCYRSCTLTVTHTTTLLYICTTKIV